MIKNQNGSALIVVLILLLAIIVIGTLAVRQGLVSLNIATNSQAQQLLIQNSDSAFFNAEQEENIIQALSSSGMFGYISGANDKDKELVFCYRGAETSYFDINRASIIYWKAGDSKPTNNELGTDGYCTAQTSAINFFTSGRKSVMTQVSVKFSSISENDPFYGEQFGTDNQSVKFERSKPVKIFAVSLMPTLSGASMNDIDGCLKNHMSEVIIPETTPAPSILANDKKSVTECLADLNVPFTTHVTEYVIVQDFV